MSRRRVGALAMLGVLLSCVAGNVERHRLADGSWQFTCKLAMDECIRHVEAVCHDKRYRIVAGQSKNVVRDVPPGTREYHTSELTVLCTDQETGDFTSATVAGGPTLSRGDGGTLPICAPGASQACVGPAGCQGGQACRADGSGFGPCDCGTTKPSGDGGP